MSTHENDIPGRHEAIEAELASVDYLEVGAEEADYAEEAELVEGVPLDDTVPSPEPATQEANPVRTMNRTGVQAFLGAALGLLVLVPLILSETLAAVGESLPPQVYAWLTAALAVSTAVSVWVSRIMTIPGVNEWLREHAAWIAPDREGLGK